MKQFELCSKYHFLKNHVLFSKIMVYLNEIDLFNRPFPHNLTTIDDILHLILI